MISGASVEARYGWVIVGAGLLSIALHTATGYSNALFLVAITEDTGWSRAVVSTCLSVYALGSGLWVPLLGFLVPVLGPRRLLPVGGMVLAGGLLALSNIQSPLALLLVMFFPVAMGSTSLGSLVNFSAIQNWFLERRGMALGLAACGVSIGVLLMPLVQASILSFGWRVAYRTMAAAVLVLVVIHVLVQRQPSPMMRPAAGASVPALNLGITTILRNPDFWLLFLGIGTSAFAGSLIMIHHVAFLTDHGFDSGSVAAALGLVGAVGLVGRIGSGWLSDRIGTRRVFVLVTALMLVAIGFLILAGRTASLLYVYLFAIAFGAGLGVGNILFARLAADRVGSRNFSRVMGLAFVGGSIGAATGPVFAGFAYDLVGSYLSSLVVASIALLIALGCSWRLGDSHRQLVAD